MLISLLCVVQKSIQILRNSIGREGCQIQGDQGIKRELHNRRERRRQTNSDPIQLKGKYTVTLIEGDGIGPEISQSVKDIFTAAKVRKIVGLEDPV